MAKKSDRVVAFIGIFKLIKAALLIALGIAGLAAIPSDLAHRLRHAIAWMGISPGHHTLFHLLGKLRSFDDGTARKLAVASLCYAAVFLVEGIGLLSKQRWAEWMTVGVTASFIPIEIYEAVEHFGPGKIVALALNLAILIYLVWRRIGAARSLRTVSASWLDTKPPPLRPDKSRHQTRTDERRGRRREVQAKVFQYSLNP